MENGPPYLHASTLYTIPLVKNTQTKWLALNLTASYWDSVSTSGLRMFHGKYWLQCSLHAKKHVNFFFIQKSNRACPLRENDTTIWNERYDSYVRNCHPLNSGENFGKRENPPLSLIDSEPPPKRQLISSPNESIAASTSQQCSIADGCDAHVDDNVENNENASTQSLVDLALEIEVVDM